MYKRELTPEIKKLVSEIKGKKRAEEHAYFHAVGRFVHQVAKVEFILHFTFSRYANIPNDTASIIKSGMKAKELISRNRALLAIRRVDEVKQKDANECFDQFIHIADFRDRVIHRGADWLGDGIFHSHNAGSMKSMESFEYTNFNVSDIKDATSDLLRIYYRIQEVVVSSGLPLEIYEKAIGTKLYGPWRYKPVKLETPNLHSTAKVPKHERPARSSRGKS